MGVVFLGSDFLRQPFELLAIDHGIVDHTEDEFFGGAATEPVDNVLNSADSDIAPAFERTIDIGPALGPVTHETFLFKAPEDRTNGGFLQRPSWLERLAAGLCRAWTVGPNEIHNHLFDGPQAF